MLQYAKFDMSRLWPNKDESMFEYWISFSPAAPVFGVDWRFGGFDIAAPSKVGKKPRTAKPQAKPSPIKEDAEDAVVVSGPAKVEKPTPKAAAPKAAEKKPEPVAKPVAASAATAGTDAIKPDAVVAAPVSAEPKSAEPVSAEPKSAEPTIDDLTVIKGVGPKMAEKLAEKGITSYAQIAKWTKAKVAKMDIELGGVPGAIQRSDWVGQAKALAEK